MDPRFRLEDQADRAQRALREVAGAAESVLADVGISLTRTPGAQPRVFVLTPDELTAVAHALAGLVPEREPEVLAEQHHRLLLDLAASLPALLRRVGLIPVRVSGADHFSQDEVMARARALVGEDEWGAVPERDRADAVAQVLRIPVDLAAGGE